MLLRCLVFIHYILQVDFFDFFKLFPIRSSPLRRWGLTQPITDLHTDYQSLRRMWYPFPMTHQWHVAAVLCDVTSLFIQGVTSLFTHFLFINENSILSNADICPLFQPITAMYVTCNFQRPAVSRYTNNVNSYMTITSIQCLFLHPCPTPPLQLWDDFLWR